MIQAADNWPGDVWRVFVPLPFPLRWMNGYAIREEEGWTLIDPGLHTREAIDAWQQFFQAKRTNFRQIRRIIVTHHHPDHYGLSGWLQRQSGAPVLLSRLAYEQTQALWGAERTLTDETVVLFDQHGLDESMLPQMRAHLESFVPQVTPAPEVELIADGETMTIAGRSYVLLATPGHAAGHLSLYDEQHGVIFCGDHVLPRITPNVSLMPGFESDPLRSYMRSLRDMRNLHVQLAFPGHRHPFRTYGERIDEILDHHRRRLDEMCMELAQQPLTAYILCCRLFGTRLSVHQLRFALAETLAHLIYLEREGRVQRADAGRYVRWRS